MTLAFEAYLDAIEEESDRIGEAAAAGTLRVSVRTCPGWDLGALVEHLCGIYHRFTAQLRAGVPDQRVDVDALPELDPIALLEQTTASLVTELREVGPNSPCWNFTGNDLTAAFVARRLANETAVHRVDAELTRHEPNPIERELAIDNIEERFEILLPRALRADPEARLGGSICLICADDLTAWTVDVERGSLKLRHGRGPADAAVVGSASDLCCFIWNRPVLKTLEVTGRRELLEAWRTLPA